MGKIVIFSGAGLDAESNIPTFREVGGIWDKYDLEKACTLDTWERYYNMTHEFYNELRVSMADKKPNNAHYSIKKICDEYNVVNYTANVSDLLEQAGVENVFHIHGKISEVIENYVDNPKITDIGLTKWYHELHPMAKPNVVFFGEMGHYYEEMFNEISTLTEDDVLIVVGSTLEINPVHYFVNMSQAKFIIIDPNAESADPESQLYKASMMADIVIPKTASEGFLLVSDYLNALVTKR